MIFSAYWYVDTLILLVTAVYLLYKYTSRKYDYWAKRGFTFIPPKPFFGNFYEISTFQITIGEYLAKLYNSTKEPFFGIYVFNKPCLVIRDPELVKHVLVKDFNYFGDRTLSDCEHDQIAHNMLFLLKNPEWKTMRKLLTPVFTSGKLKAMFPMIEEIGTEMNKYISKRLDMDVVESKEICAKYSTDVIAKCAFAINAHSFDNENADFRRVGKTAFDFTWSNAIQQTSFFFLPELVKLFKFKFINSYATDFLREVFWKALLHREATNLKGNDLIDRLVDLRKDKEFVKAVKFEGDKVVSPATQFFLAGFETTSSTIAFCMYELCIQPNIQHKLRDEIHKTIKKHNGLTYEAIMDMKYLNMCICETLRMYPVLPFLDRNTEMDYKIPGTDKILEKGTPVYIPMFGLHYDPEYFPDPKKFDPERFSDENVSKLTSFSYIPFGEGPRICIGERFGLLGTKVGLAKIISEYELIKIKETPVPLVYEQKSFILASKTGIPLKFKKCVSHAA
ncbi:unnamed protein product [Brassicogethes aeneus]|uniref:Cytochrome P450 n=1 Tax=Brassicogethes aeneus TaxID=1431903 RepID=A0A9P0B7C1_BRAAE|nr:unnamed protein product [Brassicogethes aeneus]